jgi:arylsulfatase A-like enzyme
LSSPVSEQTASTTRSLALRLREVRAVPRWLLLAWSIPTLSLLVDLVARHTTLGAWNTERWLVYALTLCWGYLSWAVAAMIGIRFTHRSKLLGRAWFGFLSVLLGLSLACTWAYYSETSQYPTWSEVVFLIEESGNAQGTVGLLSSKFSGALLVFALSAGSALLCWWRTSEVAPDSATAKRWHLASLAGLSFVLWLVRSGTHGMADAAPLAENGPVVAGMVTRYYATRNRGVFHETKRTRVPALVPQTVAPNVVLIVNESLSRKALSLYGSLARTTPKLEQRVALDPASWFVFPRAVSNSSNTSVSVPTILLGLTPGSSLDTFHAAPALWHYARAAGYHTALLSAQSWHYASLDHFLLSDPPDTVWTAEPENGIVLANGGGMNDTEFFPQIEQRLAADARTGKPFLEVIQFNATHYPFLEQPASGFDISTRVGRYNGAVLLLDTLLERLLQTLAANGVGDNTVVLITSDHGENHGEHVVHRTHSFYEEVVGIPFILHVPAAVREARAADYARLRSQLAARAQNLDVVPTLLDVMGVWDAAALKPLREKLDGQSLMHEVAPSRVNIHRNVVPIRVWSNEGFALTRDDERYSFTEWRGDEWYNLATDPEQVHDLAPSMTALPPWAKDVLAAHPELAELRAEYCPHLARCLQ